MIGLFLPSLQTSLTFNGLPHRYQVPMGTACSVLRGLVDPPDLSIIEAICLQGTACAFIVKIPISIIVTL